MWYFMWLFHVSISQHPGNIDSKIHTTRKNKNMDTNVFLISSSISRDCFKLCARVCNRSKSNCQEMITKNYKQAKIEPWTRGFSCSQEKWQQPGARTCKKRAPALFASFSSWKWCEHDVRVYIVLVIGYLRDFHKCAANWFLSSKVMNRFSWLAESQTWHASQD